MERGGDGGGGNASARVRPANGFERMLLKARRALGDQKRLEGLRLSLIGAMESFDAKRTRQLALGGASLDGEPMALAAVLRGEFGISVVELFLSLGADPDQMAAGDDGVRRPLTLIALKAQRWESAMALLAKSRRPLARGEDGSGLWIAAASSLIDGVNYLKDEVFTATIARLGELGADPNETLTQRGWGPVGATALALCDAWPMMIEALLKAGADPRIADEQGVTPLMRAAGSGNGGEHLAVRQLLDAGADSMAVDADGRDALDWLARGPTELLKSDFKWVRSAWRNERVARDLISAGVPSLGRSRLDSVAESIEGEDGLWRDVVRAEEERQELEASSAAASARPKAARL